MATNQTITDKQSLDVYTQLRSVPVGQLDETKVKKILSESPAFDKVKDKQRAVNVFYLIQKIAHQVDEKQWLDFAQSNELPPVKLTPEEMEFVRGGAVVTLLAGLTAIVVGFTFGTVM